MYMSTYTYIMNMMYTHIEKPTHNGSIMYRVL